MTDQKVVLITGASSGIGRATAELLTSRGYRVFGTARNPDTVVPLQGVELLPLDVRDDGSVQAGVETALSRGGRIDVLVNNAGYAVVGAIEETSPSEAQALFDTNVFGVLRMVRAVLPAMRRQGSGTIVNTSSVLGFLPAPFMGLYASTKHALEGLSESLDHEVRGFGIRVVLVEPGFTKTQFGANAIHARQTIAAYAGTSRQVSDAIIARTPRCFRPGDRRRGDPARDRAVPPDASAGRFRGAAPEQAAPLHAGRTGRSERPQGVRPDLSACPSPRARSAMNHRNRVLLAAAALATAIGLGSAAAISLGSASPVESDPRQGPPLVQIAIAKPAQAAERAFTGVISARVQSNLTFRVPGKIIERLVDTGQTVRSGQPLMRIDRADYAHAIAAQIGNVAAAKARLTQAAADEARYRGAVSSGAVSRSAYDQAKAAADSARALLSAAEAQLKVAQDEGEYATLVADADGTIVETLAEPGQFVAAGQVVLELAHAGPREAAVHLPETLRPAIGSSAQAKLYGSSSSASPARLRQLSEAADPATRTYEARYVLEGEAARAPLGATVTVRVATNEAGEATEVPIGALYDDGKSTGLWVLDPATSSISFRTVQVRRLATETAVIGGVRSGERVVALGAHLLHEGERVRVAEQMVAAQ